MSPPTAEGGRLRSQDVRTSGDPTGLNGALIHRPRFRAAAPGNPNFSSSDPNTRRIVGYGLRNSFRMAIRPGTNDVYMGEPGGRGLRLGEINRVPDPLATPVRNFGWPCYEGATRTVPRSTRSTAPTTASTSICARRCMRPAPRCPRSGPTSTRSRSFQVRPVPTRGHASSGLAFAPASGNFPASRAGPFFFADYARDCIWVMQAGQACPIPRPSRTSRRARPPRWTSNSTRPTSSTTPTSPTARSNGSSTAGNLPPALAQADPQGGPVPLTVDFDATGSSDPNPEDTLTYKWDLDGDGQLDDSTVAQPKLPTTPPGCTGDARGDRHRHGLGPDTVTINASSSPARRRASYPHLRDHVARRSGDQLLRVRAADPEDGVLPASALDWS